MENTAAVAVSQAVQNLDENTIGFLLFKFLMLFDILKQISTVYIFSDKEYVILTLKHFL